MTSPLEIARGLLILLIGLSAPYTAFAASAESPESKTCAPWLKHNLRQLHSGKPLLLVNTASHCGFTGQFEGLEELHQAYKDQGLVIIGFPSNAFNQAALNEEEVAKVCFYNFGVTFLISQPIEITGNDAHPLFQHLTQQQRKPS